ncbi:ExbD/TolR family protein [Deminuibacter soli]|uniref:Biopolymer transporter ExbD n=1 Tax=Deminuibacter soli TaxID=2291815 RepID=A0A3E1NR99_9BACT|nr:biopolymer transporter ExbD [Deminuibacter soli]RFM30308.1 biopolymer transporter ExbD [Deminuibacter soli]
MAEIISTQNNRHVHGKKGKKLSTRVDLTPMVDLGFLLITFFIFTTTLTTPKALDMVMPDDKPTQSPTEVGNDKTLQLQLNGDHVVYYNGNDSLHTYKTDYAIGVRNVIQQKMNTVQHQFGNARETVILIKPTDAASLQQLVSVLDEMRINGVQHYVLL